MKSIRTSDQLRAADAHTISVQGLASIDLMERAANACTTWLLAHVPPGSPFLVVAGPGNNGGDGLAIARQLKALGRYAKVLLAIPKGKCSADLEANRARWLAVGGELVDVSDGSIREMITDDQVVVDCLFGSGLDRPISGDLKGIVQAINEGASLVVSIDMPSGLFAEDNSSNDPTAIVKADDLLTFERPRLAFLLPENEAFVGQWHVLPIGLDQTFLDDQAGLLGLVEEQDIARLLRPRPRFAHKGHFGHALLLAGSKGKGGAAVLAARACARSGAGLCTVRLPGGLMPVIHSTVPEVMADGSPSPDRITSLPGGIHSTAIGAGPGMGTDPETAQVLKLLIQQMPAPLVLDADALNILAENRTWLGFLPKGSILTPHPKEFERLAGKASSGYERLGQARDFAVRYGVVLVLKGAFTAVCTPDARVFFNPTGNPGMAKGGTGDALLGLITGLLAQGMPPQDAAIVGTYVHGAAGDLVAEALGMDGMICSDLIDHLPLVWKRIRAGT